MENRQKDGDDCCMLTKEDFTAVKEELADDFVTLADEQLAVVRQLVADRIRFALLRSATTE